MLIEGSVAPSLFLTIRRRGRPSSPSDIVGRSSCGTWRRIAAGAQGIEGLDPLRAVYSGAMWQASRNHRHLTGGECDELLAHRERDFSTENQRDLFLGMGMHRKL